MKVVHIRLAGVAAVQHKPQAMGMLGRMVSELQARWQRLEAHSHNRHRM